MIARRHLVLLPLTVCLPSARAQQPAKIYVGFPPGGTVQIAASVTAEALAKQSRLVYQVDCIAGDFTKLSLAAFRADPAAQDKLLLATPSPGYPPLTEFKLLAVVGQFRNLPEPFGFYADKRMPPDKADVIRGVVEQLMAANAFPRR